MTDERVGWGTVRYRRALQILAALVAALLVTYGVGYTIFPPLLVPIGCAGLSEEVVEVAPNGEFNLTYSAEAGALTVTYSEGPTLPAHRVTRIEIRTSMQGGQAEREYSWAEADGEYPVRPGDSITIENASVAGRPLEPGDVVRVIWHGRWEDPAPDYCPEDHDSVGSATLAKLIVE